MGGSRPRFEGLNGGVAAADAKVGGGARGPGGCSASPRRRRSRAEFGRDCLLDRGVGITRCSLDVSLFTRCFPRLSDPLHVTDCMVASSHPDIFPSLTFPVPRGGGNFLPVFLFLARMCQLQVNFLDVFYFFDPSIF